MSQITKPIILDETGRELIAKIEELKNVLSPTGTLIIGENGVYDVSEKSTVIVNSTSARMNFVDVAEPVSINSDISMSEVVE